MEDTKGNKKIITRYVSGQDDELSPLWDYDAPQQDNYHYVLYETDIKLEVDMDTGRALIIAVNGEPLVNPVAA